MMTYQPRPYRITGPDNMELLLATEQLSTRANRLSRTAVFTTLTTDEVEYLEQRGLTVEALPMEASADEMQAVVDWIASAIGGGATAKLPRDIERAKRRKLELLAVAHFIAPDPATQPHHPVIRPPEQAEANVNNLLEHYGLQPDDVANLNQD